MKYIKTKTPTGWAVAIMIPGQPECIVVHHNGNVQNGNDDRCSLKELVHSLKIGECHEQRAGLDRTSIQWNQRAMIRAQQQLVASQQQLTTLKAELERLENCASTANNMRLGETIEALKSELSLANDLVKGLEGNLKACEAELDKVKASQRELVEAFGDLLADKNMLPPCYPTSNTHLKNAHKALANATKLMEGR